MVLRAEAELVAGLRGMMVLGRILYKAAKASDLT